MTPEQFCDELKTIESDLRMLAQAGISSDAFWYSFNSKLSALIKGTRITPRKQILKLLPQSIQKQFWRLRVNTLHWKLHHTEYLYGAQADKVTSSTYDPTKPVHLRCGYCARPQPYFMERKRTLKAKPLTFKSVQIYVEYMDGLTIQKCECGKRLSAAVIVKFLRHVHVFLF